MDKVRVKNYAEQKEFVCRNNDWIAPELYDQYGVQKGLRDKNGNGVPAGLTNISKVTSSKIVDGKKVPCDGQLWYRGYRVQDLLLYQNVEELAPQLIAKHRKIYKGVSPNVDFYSGFVYDMLGIPQELYTAMFAIARIVSWSAHRIEELICMDKIIRPAYMSVMEERKG